MHGRYQLTQQMKDKELPAYMEWGHGLDEGEVVYKHSWLDRQTFITPCGILLKGESLFNGLSTGGYDWIAENDRAICHCPLRANECDKRDSHLSEKCASYGWCNVHMTDQQYVYDGSLEDIEKKSEKRRHEAINKYLEDHPRSCRQQIGVEWDGIEPKIVRKWRFENCVQGKCGYCPVRDRKMLEKGTGNVFYDLKYTATDHTKDGTFWDGELFTGIEKGKQFFKSPISLILCEEYAKGNAMRDIQWKENMERHSEMFWEEQRGCVLKVEVINVRAEKKVSRDLEQDLKDIEAGIKVTHSIDEKKREKKEKHEKRELAKEKRRQAILNKIEKGAELSMAEQRNIEKLGIEWSEIKKAKDKHKEQASISQMSIFDFMKG